MLPSYHPSQPRADPTPNPNPNPKPDPNPNQVRAHYCAFESFQADVALHDLVIPDAGRYRAPHALGEVHGFPAAAPGGAARWAIGVYNFDRVKSEACEISVRTLTLTIPLALALTLTLTLTIPLALALTPTLTLALTLPLTP